MLRLTQGLGAPVNTPPGARLNDRDVGQYYRHTEGWDVYAARNGNGACAVVNSKTLNQDVIDQLWVDVGPDGVGYNANCDCYCPGYRPKWEPVEILGLGVPPRGPSYSVVNGGRDAFKVCTGYGYASDNGCKNCPPPADCPTCPKPPPPALQQQGSAGEWGTNLGWLLAGAVLAGGGYYAYKKGVFKKSYWKKLGRKR